MKNIGIEFEPILKKNGLFYFEITICDFKIAYFRI